MNALKIIFSLLIVAILLTHSLRMLSRSQQQYEDIGGVKNPLHWRLDVVFGDDASRIKGNAATIMTSIRYLCMNFFQQESSSLSLAKKKRKAAWNDNYRAKVMFSSDF